jgi:hypothetical protein
MTELTAAAHHRAAPAITIDATTAHGTAGATTALMPGRHGRSSGQAAAATRAPGSRSTPHGARRISLAATTPALPRGKPSRPRPEPADAPICTIRVSSTLGRSSALRSASRQVGGADNMG